MTKDDWIIAARDVLEAAFRVDPVHTDEVCCAVTGGSVFAWSALTTRQVRALHRALFSTARLLGLVLVFTLVGCAADAPGATYGLVVRTPELAPDLAHATQAWRSIGIDRDDEASDPIYIERVPAAAIPADGLANRADRTVMISDRISGFRLWIVLAHEIGHVVLDTPEHTTCGIMAAADLQPCAEDIALACNAFPTLEVCP